MNEFHMACKNSDIKKIKELYPLATDDEINQGLDIATVLDNLDVIKCIYGCGAKIKADKLFRAAVIHGFADIVDYFISLNDIDLNYNYQDLVPGIIEHNIEESFCTSFTPLHFAVINKNIYILTKLLETEKCKVNCTDFRGMTPLFWAVQTGIIQIVDLLIVYGADYYHIDNKGNTLLHHSVVSHENDVDITERILSLGLDINSQNNEGETTLHIACIWENSDAVKILLKHGANIDIKDTDGKTPGDYFNVGIFDM